MKRTILFWGLLNLVVPGCIAGKAPPTPSEGFLWYPYLEWTLTNEIFVGNPFDLIATVTFVHEISGEKRKTGMFYDGNNIWKFRFSGTRLGKWHFMTSSEYPSLNAKSGTFFIKHNPDKGAHGFIKKFEHNWGWQGTESAFIPQYVMYHHPKAYYQNPQLIEADIKNFIEDHGFTGFHTNVFCRWFDINNERSNKIPNIDPNPDRRTFQALEMLITKTHSAGGSVHIWCWGDEQRKMTPVKWGINEEADRRLQRYIAARLGPLPGWTMGYGFDLHEWVEENDLKKWHSYMHRHLGWSHFLGGRASKNKLDQIYEGLDYASYEQHRPGYNKYVETIDKRPHKPSFSEDRFRINITSKSRRKDYNPTLVRRGLWHSAMAGGVANIWGNLGSNLYSKSFPNKQQIKTYSTFMNKFFKKEMIRDNAITDGVCLKSKDNKLFIFYKENASLIYIDISKITGNFKSISVNTQKRYEEIPVDLMKTKQKWKAPYVSDWAIAVQSIWK